jgi:hypothetical protein
MSCQAKLRKITRTAQSRSSLPLPLLQKDYKNVKFWVEKAYEELDDDGLATKKPRCDWPSRNSENDEEKHPYLDNDDGIPVDRQRVAKFNDRARKIFNLLRHADLSPASWAKLGLDAYKYFKSEMMTELKEFRLCEGSWKLDRLPAARAYASWRQYPKIRE